MINSGPLKGRFCVILNIVDHRRVLIDAPRVKGSGDQTDLKRQTYPTRHLRLTRFKLRLRHDENHDVVAKLWNEAKLTEKVNNTRYVQRQLKQQRVSIFLPVALPVALANFASLSDRKLVMIPSIGSAV